MMDLEQYRQILEFSPNLIWRSNLSTECDYFNKTWLDFTGRSLEDELGFGWAQGVHPDDFDRCVKIYTDNFNKQQKFEMDYRLKRFDGQYRWINDRGTPFYSDNGEFLGFVGSCMDVTEKIEGQLLKKMAQIDSLCNTYNRQYSMQLLSEVFNNIKLNPSPLSLLMIDIDNFKTINDNYGHLNGDKVLSSIASLIKSELRTPDIFGRYGGDEFLIGLINTDKLSAIGVAKRIIKTISQSGIKTNNDDYIYITLSIGVTTIDKESSLDEFINNADKKLYEAKRNGKNSYKA
ncbi:MAG: sensor domain-containing diguanylate cyclase [Firmicutes bacterium]|nr:sensor domain-containing diguanylate cyclase [Bacillota bacterium]